MNAQFRDAVSLHVTRLFRAERERQGLSMNRLAEMAGLHHSAISLIERELRNPSLDTLIRISDVLKVDLGAIIQQAYRAAQRSGG